MPIRPENRARYPADWPDIRARIRERSGNRCECTGQCGLTHSGADWEARCDRWHMMPIDDITGPKIVLTVAHLNHQPEDNRDENLLHLCQGCHNRYDLPMRREGTRQRRRAAMACDDLFRTERKP